MSSEVDLGSGEEMLKLGLSATNRQHLDFSSHIFNRELHLNSEVATVLNEEEDEDDDDDDDDGDGDEDDDAVDENEGDVDTGEIATDGFQPNFKQEQEISDVDDNFAAEGDDDFELNSNDSSAYGNNFPIEDHFLSANSNDSSSVDNSNNGQSTSQAAKVVCPKCKKTFRKCSLGAHIRMAHPVGVRSYMCQEEGCSRSFHTKKRLDYHAANEHGDNAMDTGDVPENRQCPVCKAIIKSLSDYKYHVQREHSHSCDHCEMRFAAKQKLEEHVLQDHNIDIRVDKKCRLCGANQKGLTDYYRHVSKDHNWSCDFEGCNLRFACKQKLEDHTLAVHNIDIKVDKTCTMCKQEIRSLSDFRQHIARDHKYACIDDNCSLRFACKQKFEEHTIAAHNIDVRIDRTCPQCQNLIRGLTDYFRHIQKDHKFHCEECPLKFAYKMKYEDHMLAVHNKDVKVDKTCQVCQVSIRSLTDYKRHIAMNHKFDCVCELKFACKQKLEEHTLAVHGIDIRVDKTCPMCKTSIRSLSDYNRHITTEHRWQCPHCDLKFAYKQKLDEHGAIVHQVEIGHIPLFSCQTCGLSFDHKPVFENHLELPHNVACDYCDMMFTYHHKMVQHAEKDHQLLVQSKEEQMTCKLCRLTFPTLSRMEQHCTMDHKYPCGVQNCQLIFVSKFKLEEHAADVHKVNLDPDKTHVCGQCGQCFSRPENLKKHEERPHEFQCEHCSKIFIAMDRLEKHCIKDHKVLGDSAVDETATDIRDNLVCPMCDKNFKQLHILRKHKEIEHKFLCPACDKKFTMKHWLREHMKIVHDIEDELKPSFACEMCDNTFSDNYGYKRHLKIEHTHDCSFCDKKFTMKKFLNTHQLYLHGVAAPGMKIPEKQTKEQILLSALKPQFMNLKGFKTSPSNSQEPNEMNEFEPKFKRARTDPEPTGGEPLADISKNINGSKLKKPPPPLIKIENLLPESDSEEEIDEPFKDDVESITDVDPQAETFRNDGDYVIQEDDVEPLSYDDDSNDELNDDSDEEDGAHGDHIELNDFVTVDPNYEVFGEEYDDTASVHETNMMEPCVEIEETFDHNVL